MKQVLSILIIIGMALSVGIQFNSSESKQLSFAGNEFKCPMTGKALGSSTTPFSCPKTSKNGKCQKKFFNLINSIKIDYKMDLNLFLISEFININHFINFNNIHFIINNKVPDNPEPPGYLPLLI
jgi:hypothetical protein